LYSAHPSGQSSSSSFLPYREEFDLFVSRHLGILGVQPFLTRPVVAGLNQYKRAGIEFWGGDLREGFDLTKQELPGWFDFIFLHPPYWNIVSYNSGENDLSSVEDYEQFRQFLMLCLKRC